MPDGIRGNRYYIPGTEYFQGVEGDGLSLADEALWAQARRRGDSFPDDLLQVSFRARPRLRYDYSPGAADPVELGRMLWEMGITTDVTASDAATRRWSKAAVVTIGTAPLGEPSVPRRENGVLISGLARPIMLKKAAIFKYGADVDTEAHSVEADLFPHQIEEMSRVTDPEIREALLDRFDMENLAYVIKAVHNVNAGFINVEDVKGRTLDLLFRLLEERGVTSARWSDDKEGTGIVTAALVLAWAYEQGRLRSGPNPLEDLIVELHGPGAGGSGTYNELINWGVPPENILVNDSKGILHAGRTDIRDSIKKEMARHHPAGTTRESFLRSKERKIDVFINLGVRETVTRNLPGFAEFLRDCMNPTGLVSVQTNPDPGITPEWLKKYFPLLRYASGNVRFKNCANNFAAFSHVGRGTLWSRSPVINRAMRMAAAWGILEVGRMGPPDWLRDRLPPEQREFGSDWLLPHPFDIRLIKHEAAPVALAAITSGASLLVPQGRVLGVEEVAAFQAWIAQEAAITTRNVVRLRREAEANEPRHFRARYGRKYSPVFIGEEGWDIVPEVREASFKVLVGEMGITREAWKAYRNSKGHLRPAALSEIIKQLDPGQGPEIWREVARRDRLIIFRVAMVHPSLGMALALQRLALNTEHADNGHTIGHLSIFEMPGVLAVAEREVPRVRQGLEDLLDWLATQEDELTRLAGTSVRVHREIPPHPEHDTIHLTHQLRQMGYNVSFHQVRPIPEAHRTHLRGAISSRNHGKLAHLVREHVSSHVSLPVPVGTVSTATPLTFVEAVL